MTNSLTFDSKWLWCTEEFMVNSTNAKCQGPVSAKKPRSPPCFTVGLRCFLHFGVVPFIFWFVQMQLWKPKHFQRDEIFSRELFKNKPQLFCLFLNVLSWILTFNILTEACRSWDVTLRFTPVSIIQSDFKLNFSFLGSLWHWANTNLNAPDQQIMIQQIVCYLISATLFGER